MSVSRMCLGRRNKDPVDRKRGTEARHCIPAVSEWNISSNVGAHWVRDGEQLEAKALAAIKVRPITVILKVKRCGWQPRAQFSSPKWAGLHEACDKKDAHPQSSSQPLRHAVLSQLPRVPTMEAESQQPKKREDVIPALNAAIEALDLAEKNSSITPAKTVFATVSSLLATIRVCLLRLNDLLQAYT